MTDFNTRVWEAFWADGNNKDGLERVVAVVFAEAARIAKEAADDAPDVADNGGTRDGWEMACKDIAARFAVKSSTPTVNISGRPGDYCADNIHSTPISPAQIKHMVDRFLMWRLPANFRPDNGISYTNPYPHIPMRPGPMGTNLVDAVQAEAMVRHMLEKDRFAGDGT